LVHNSGNIDELRAETLGKIGDRDTITLLEPIATKGPDLCRERAANAISQIGLNLRKDNQ
jgi:hypothetical protein